MTDAETFRAIARALYGTGEWTGSLSADLHVAPRTLARWASGRMPIPPGVWLQLQELLKIHSEKCAELAEACKGR